MIRFELVKSLPYFLGGSILGHYYAGIRRKISSETGLVYLILTFLPLLYPRLYQSVFGAPHGMWQSPYVLAVMLAGFCLVVTFGSDRTFFSNSVFNYLGKISYSMYLIHVPILLIAGRFLQESLATASGAIGYLSAVILLSTLSYFIVERPSRSFIRKWRLSRTSRNLIPVVWGRSRPSRSTSAALSKSAPGS